MSILSTEARKKNRRKIQRILKSKMLIEVKLDVIFILCSNSHVLQREVMEALQKFEGEELWHKLHNLRRRAVYHEFNMLTVV